MKTSFATILIAVSIGAVVMATSLFLGPQRISTSQEHTGDPQLSAQLANMAPKGSHTLASFTLDGSTTTFAGLGADEHTEFEIGSITKTFTADLLSQAVDRGELTLETTVGDIIDVDGTEIADITLKELATHTSGLPRMSRMGLSMFTSIFTGANPYDEYSIEALFEDARETSLSDRGTYEYSNFGFALLGQLIAHNAHREYEEMLYTDILKPLEMTETYLMSPGTVPAEAPRGLTSRGRESEPWEMEGDAAAGAIRSTAHDMAKYAQYILGKPLPDYTWSQMDGGLFQHNGGTGGYRSILLVDPESNKASFAANSSTADIDDLGPRLLDGINP